MIKILLTLLVSALLCAGAFAQSPPAGTADTIVTFRFVAGDDMFYIPWNGNGAELNRLYALVDEYRAEITAGTMPVYVDGYCTSGLQIAVIRANRVKSELIAHKGLREEHFVTKNRTTAYRGPDGVSYKDIVVVTLRISPLPTSPQGGGESPQGGEDPKTVSEFSPLSLGEGRGEVQPVVEKQPEPQIDTIPSPGPAAPSKPCRFAVRTNLLYDAFLLPTLGVEWRVSNSVGIKLDGSYAFWGDETGMVQKMWLLNPEVRWYLLDNKRFYVGASANFGEYNIYKGMLGGLASKDTGYQGTMTGAGLTAGYRLPLNRSFSLDFNLGLGYTRFNYDSFTMIDAVRVYRAKSQTKNFWGPTQAGINLVWTIGGNEQ